jgi:spore maturation protein CgeB
MKFLQLATYYHAYLSDFYRQNPHLSEASFDMQISELIRDGFGAGHIVTPYMLNVGYESQLIIANCSAQLRWAQEHNMTHLDSQYWMFEIAKKQVETFKPDILYNLDPITFDSRFIRNLSWKPSLIIAWRAATIPNQVDWKDLDVILSNSSVCLRHASKLGVKATEYYHPGFAPFIEQIVREEPKQWDVVFSGQWTPEHKKRNAFLTEVTKTSQNKDREFSLGFFIPTQHPGTLPDDIAKHNHGSRWGIHMFRALKSGRIVLNAAIDMAEGEAPNMRLFEVTGVGSFLLTEHQHNIQNFFEPGVEIETFKDQNELIEKIYYYLGHPEEREAIARRGQERCLRDYSMTKRAEEFDRIIKKHLKQKSKSTSPVEAQKIELSEEEDPYDIAYKWGWNNPQLRELVYLCYKTPDFADNARRFFLSTEFHEAVRILSELGKKPDKSIRVLDFGCGNGVASYALARMGYSVVGVDSSLGEIAGLNAAKKIQDIDGIHFDIVHSTGEKIDFRENAFDVIWIREALHHIKNLSEFLSEIKRILKPDGILCCLRDVVIWNENQREHFFATHPFNHITKDEGCYYLEKYLSAFNNAGLLVEKILYPLTSIINTYPDTPKPGVTFDENKAKQRQQGYDLFSFFVRKSKKEDTKMQVSPELLGSKITIGKDVQIIGLKNVYIGEGSCISDNVWLNICVRDKRLRMKIGKCVLIGRQSVISTAGYLEIGDFCVLAPRVFVSDADHVFTDIYQPILQQGTTNNRSVIIEENCWLGIQSVASGNLTIGRGSVVAANAVVTKDVPPFSVVAGVPAKIIKMYNPLTKQWEKIIDETHRGHILKIREDVGIPSRDEYREILAKTATFRQIEPLIAGRSFSI